MLTALGWRIVGACLAASAAGLITSAMLLQQTGDLRFNPGETPAAIIWACVVGLSAAVAIAVAGTRWLVLRSTSRSVQSVIQWARSVGGGARDSGSGPNVDSDLAEMAVALRELTRALQLEIGALQGERSRLAIALDHMESGVVVSDGDHRIALINPAAARLLRTTPQAAEGRSLVEIARDHELVAVAASASLAGDGGAAPTIIDLGDPPRSVQVVATAIPRGGRDRPGALLLLQDVTQLRQAEVVRREFVANVSHELRTPLAGLKALAETLDAGALEDPSSARGFLGRMLVEVDRLNELVQELLELALLQSAAPSLAHEKVDLYDLARRAELRLAARAEQAEVAVAIDPPGDGAMVDGDPLRLERVFVNLIENAIKYTTAGGRVTVRFVRSANEIIASVNDTGQGISAEDLPRIFERFYKGDKARSSPGSGLGLAIVKHTIQAHGGRVWAQSTEGRGSTLFIGLPSQS